MMKRLAALLTAAAILGSPLCVHALETEQAEGYARGIIEYEKRQNGIGQKDGLLSGAIAEDAGSEASDWAAIGAVRFGLEEDTAEYREAWAENISERDMSRAKATEVSRAVLTAVCIGADPSDVSGVDLLAEGIFRRDDMGRQGLNGWIWTLIALDSYDRKLPEDAAVTRLDILNAIIAAQNEDGGFSVEAGVGASDPDITAMAVQALSPYRECDEAKAVIVRAMEYLAREQDSFTSCETVSQMVCALCCIGIDPDEYERFSALTDALISYANDDGGFAHEMGGESSGMASAQALIALCSLSRLRGGERAVYDMNDGEPAPPTEGSLEEVAEAKGRNTEPPRVSRADEPAEHGGSGRNSLVITAALAVLAAGGALFMRKTRRRK